MPCDGSGNALGVCIAAHPFEVLVVPRLLVLDVLRFFPFHVSSLRPIALRSPALHFHSPHCGRTRSHLELLDLQLAAVVDDGGVLDERLGGAVRRDRRLVAPCLTDEEHSGTRRRSEHVVGNAPVLLERRLGQLNCGCEGIRTAAFLGLKKQFNLSIVLSFLFPCSNWWSRLRCQNLSL